MTFYALTENAITTYLGTAVEDVVTVQGDTIPVSLEVAYGNDDDEALPDDQTHVRSIVNWGPDEQVSLGDSPHTRGNHTLLLQIFTPIDIGTFELNAVADQAKAAFTRARIGRACFREPSLTTLPRQGKWFRANLSCPFFTTEQHPTA